MLNAEFLNKTWREDTRGECTTEDRAELRIQTADTHVFELEVGRDNGVGGCSDTLVSCLLNSAVSSSLTFLRST